MITRTLRAPVAKTAIFLRQLHHSSQVLQGKRFEFYDEEVRSEQPPMKSDQDTVNSLTFETNTPGGRKMNLEDIFGSGGKKQTISSRMDLSYRADVRKIGGIEVPRRPIEPTNCCGSGCVNCVWVIFDDDMEEWKDATRDAVEMLNSQDKSKGDDELEKWPLGFDPPPKGLDAAFIPDALKEQTKEEVSSKMPIQFSVFTNFERNMKKKKLSKSTSETDLSQVPANDFVNMEKDQTSA